MSFDPVNTTLVRGITRLEASAGTGKTFTLAGVFLRLVLEFNVPATEILVVTYTKAATAELRGRIRCRLREAQLAFKRKLGQAQVPSIPIMDEMGTPGEGTRPTFASSRR